jgi:ring-1,2-phenylacetyl-CoA epoxidase subunit PaaA
MTATSPHSASAEAATIAPVKSVAEFAAQPPEFQDAIRKIVRSHSINELYGAQVFDEPAIAYAPTPYAKWLTCRVAMEEYGHHVRFRELGEQIGIPAEQLVPGEKKPLSIFSFKLERWEEFCVIKLLADLAEILQVEDLLHCAFHPLRNLARMTMPEERFHSEFGIEMCEDIVEKQGAGAKPKLQRYVNQLFPEMVKFFGSADSKNNAIYRKWGIKKRSNEEMRADYIRRARELVEGRFGLKLPAVN